MQQLLSFFATRDHLSRAWFSGQDMKVYARINRRPLGKPWVVPTLGGDPVFLFPTVRCLDIGNVEIEGDLSRFSTLLNEVSTGDPDTIPWKAVYIETTDPRLIALCENKGWERPDGKPKDPSDPLRNAAFYRRVSLPQRERGLRRVIKRAVSRTRAI